MLGNIIGIDANIVNVKLTLNINEVQSLINLYVILEITDIKDGVAFINMLGQIKDGKFVSGITKKPSFGAQVKLIAPDKVNFIVGVENYQDDRDLYIGKSPIYEGIDICANVNSLFSNHFAILELFKTYLKRKMRLLTVLVSLSLMLMENIITHLKPFKRKPLRFVLKHIRRISMMIFQRLKFLYGY